MVMGSVKIETELAIIGGGPGGYVAAIRAADLGKEVVVIEEREKLGGVCLTEGCIPSKALIHAIEIKNAAADAKNIGLTFGEPVLDLDKLRTWKDSVVNTLTFGVLTLLTKRGIEVIHKRASFLDNKTLFLDGGDQIKFKDCIIATGSHINHLPPAFNLPVWTSQEALTLPFIPERLLVAGGGYIGLEMGTAYAGLGSKVSMVEFNPRLLMGADQDLVRVVVKRAEKLFEAIKLESKVISIEQTSNGFAVTIEHEGQKSTDEYSQVLVAIGRKPNSDNIGLEHTNIKPNQFGTIPVNNVNQTTEEHIYAIGDVAPGLMLAHKASREGKVVAEVLAGMPSAFDNVAVPAVVFTHPEMAWVGLTEAQAEKDGIKVNVGRFPLSALGRARTLNETDGFVKILADPDTDLILGMAMVGPSASELIGEGALAIEMGATLEDMLVTIHPHPTMSEALIEAAEVAKGEPIHILPKKKN
jgi:dihydrolipoamide dehydrogenase